jgi:hypothetical protein
MMGRMGVVIGLVIVVAAVVAGIAVRVWRRDEVFEGITPGLLPAPGQPTVRRHLRRGEQPPVAVRFNPPDGVGPGLAGVAIDGRVDPVELSATLIDLGQRGWLQLHPLTKQPGDKPYDWEIRASSQPPNEQLSPTEQALLTAAFSAGPSTTLAAFRQHPEVKGAADVLLGEAASRNWLKHLAPSAVLSVKSVGPGLIGIGVLGLFVFQLGVIGIGMIIGGAIFSAMIGKLPEPLSAEGYAVRVQCEGFKQYLATAEADQLKFEVGIDTFSRYLPYAMVFGVVDHWRSVFADALAQDPSAELDGMGWLVLDDVMSTLLILEMFGGSSEIFASLATDFADFGALPGVDGILESVGDAFDGFDLGDFGD